jgi:hypothetical protein
MINKDVIVRLCLYAGHFIYLINYKLNQRHHYIFFEWVFCNFINFCLIRTPQSSWYWFHLQNAKRRWFLSVSQARERRGGGGDQWRSEASLMAVCCPPLCSHLMFFPPIVVSKLHGDDIVSIISAWWEIPLEVERAYPWIAVGFPPLHHRHSFNSPLMSQGLLFFHEQMQETYSNKVWMYIRTS